uniref:GRIP domain-containing protein n=1 Tax=Macrostomum lignano TaxID=282301 RepID=A0A1I8HJ02_9PLAT
SRTGLGGDRGIKPRLSRWLFALPPQPIQARTGRFAELDWPLLASFLNAHGLLLQPHRQTHGGLAMDTLAEDDCIMQQVTDLQQPQAEQTTTEALTEPDGLPNGEASLSPASDAEIPTETALKTACALAEPEAAGGAVAEESSATGLATPAAKRRRYRSLFGNIGKLITFRRRQEQPASPSAVAEAAAQQAESELQFPPAEPVSLDLIVPDAEALSGGGAEDPITGQLELLESLDSPSVAKETVVESSCAAEVEVFEIHEEEKVQVEDLLEGFLDPTEDQRGLQEDQKDPEPEQEEVKAKKKMEYDMSQGGISTIMEETEEAVKAQETVGLTEEDLAQLESEMDLADYDSRKTMPESVAETAEATEAEKCQETQQTEKPEAKAEAERYQETQQTAEKPEAKKSKEEPEGKSHRVAILQNQISESDSGYGYSTSDSPVEAEVEKSEKPQVQVDEVEGSSGGSDVFPKDVEDSQRTKQLIAKSEALISPSEEELASFEKAEVCVEDSTVDLVDISVKLDSLIESNSPESQPTEPEDKPATKPVFNRVSESQDEEEDEEMEPVELDLSSNQSVRRRQILEAKARRQRELEAARKQQEEVLSCLAPAAQEYESKESKCESLIPASPVKDKDIVDGLGPRRHSHENNSSVESCTEGSRSRMKSRLPVKRSASCPRRTVEEYSTYIRSGSAAKKPISHLIESGYSPVKIDFKPLSRAAPEKREEHLEKGAASDTKQSQVTGQTSRRGSKKVHFNSPTVDQVVTYAAIDNDEMKHRDSDENGQHLPLKTRQASSSAGGRVSRHKAGEAEKSTAQQHDRSAIKSISVKQTLASRKRLEKLHEDAVKQLGLQDESQYITPLQRKDLEVKELKRQLDEAYFVIEQRELELDVFHHEKSKSIKDAVKDREERIAGLQVQINQLDSDFSSLRAQHSEICVREKSLAETLEKLKAECAERERRHQDLYLEMYRKGRDSARFERQDEIEKLAVLEPDKVAMEELLEKLEITQHDLQKWQSIKLKEVYEDSDKATTEAEAKLRFLRDSMFHYLTEKDREQNHQHLMAMIGIFSFTDVQMKHIMKSLDERRRKGKI